MLQRRSPFLLLILGALSQLQNSKAFSFSPLPETPTGKLELDPWRARHSPRGKTYGRLSTAAAAVEESSSGASSSERYSVSPTTSGSIASLAAGQNLQPRIDELVNASGYERFVRAEDDRLSIVLFYAVWCKNCHKFRRLYQKLAASKADLVHVQEGGKLGDGKIKRGGISLAAEVKVANGGSLRLGQIECTFNAEFSKSLGVTKLPTLFFYKGGRKLGGYPCGGPSQFQRLLDTVEYLNSDIDNIGGEEELKLERNLQNGADLLVKAGLFDDNLKKISEKED